MPDLLRGALQLAPTLAATGALTLAAASVVRRADQLAGHRRPRRLKRCLPRIFERRDRVCAGSPRIDERSAALGALALNVLAIAIEGSTLAFAETKLFVLAGGLAHNIPELGSHFANVGAVVFGWKRRAGLIVSRMMLTSAWLTISYVLLARNHPHRGDRLGLAVAFASVACDATAAFLLARAEHGHVRTHGGEGVSDRDDPMRRQALHMKIDVATGGARIPGSAAAARGVGWVDPIATLGMALLMIWGAVHDLGRGSRSAEQPPERWDT